MRMFTISLILLLLVACHSREAVRMESERSGCAPSSITVDDSCQPGYYDLRNGCTGETSTYGCWTGLPQSMSECLRAVPCCMYPESDLPSSCRDR